MVGGGGSDGLLEVELLSLGFLEQMRGVSFISESRSDSLCLCFLCVCVCGKQERRYLVIFFCCGFVLLYRCCRGGRPERLCGIFAETCKFCLHFFFSPWLCVIPVGADFCVCVWGGGQDWLQEM